LFVFFYHLFLKSILNHNLRQEWNKSHHKSHENQGYSEAANYQNLLDTQREACDLV